MDEKAKKNPNMSSEQPRVGVNQFNPQLNNSQASSQPMATRPLTGGVSQPNLIGGQATYTSSLPLSSTNACVPMPASMNQKATQQTKTMTMACAQLNTPIPSSSSTSSSSYSNPMSGSQSQHQRQPQQQQQQQQPMSTNTMNPTIPKKEPQMLSTLGQGNTDIPYTSDIDGVSKSQSQSQSQSQAASNKANPFAQNISRTSPATVVWLHENYEAAEGVSLGRSTLYQHYADHCESIDQEPVNPASFGKLIRSVFPYLKTRRLGTRGNSKYHYYGIRVKQDSKLEFAPDQIGGPHQRIRANPGPGGAGSCIGGVNPGGKPKIKTDKDDENEAAAIDMGDFIDTMVVLPEFPPMNSVQGLEKADDFNKPYHAHCKDILKTLGKGDFLQLIPEKWSQFWGVIAIHFRDVLGSTPGVNHVDRCDEIFFATLSQAIFTDVLCSMPEELIKQIRYFAKWMEPWIKTALEGYPQTLIDKKLVRVRAFAHALRRYTSLNHLAQAAQNVLQDVKQTEQMLRDISYVDFKAAMGQAEVVCRCTTATVQRIEQDLKYALENQFSLRQWAAWLQYTIKTAVSKSAKPQDEARKFLTKWSFFSSIVIRDLTLRSAPSFGSFHLMRLLYDEYIIYLVELMDLKPMAVLDLVPAGCTRAQPVVFNAGTGPASRFSTPTLAPTSTSTLTSTSTSTSVPISMPMPSSTSTSTSTPRMPLTQGLGSGLGSGVGMKMPTTTPAPTTTTTTMGFKSTSMLTTPVMTSMGSSFSTTSLSVPRHIVPSTTKTTTTTTTTPTTSMAMSTTPPTSMLTTPRHSSKLLTPGSGPIPMNTTPSPLATSMASPSPSTSTSTPTSTSTSTSTPTSTPMSTRKSTASSSRKNGSSSSLSMPPSKIIKLSSQ